MLRIFVALLCWSGLSLQAADDLELTVHLHTESRRHPAILASSTGLPSPFIDALDLDLFHGGFLQKRPGHGDVEQVLRHGIETPSLASKLDRSGLHYGLHLWMEGQRCRLDAISHEGVLFSSLTYVMPTDPLEQRRLAHKLSDQLHEGLFQRPAIGATKILYVVSPDGRTGGASELWECDCDGRGARRLLQDQSLCLSPAFFPPAVGKRPEGFVVVSYRNGPPKILRGLFGLPALERLSSLPGNQFHPAFSPQRDRVAFISDATGNPDLFIQSFSSERGLLGKARQLFTAPRAAQASPCFSPDGKKIAFVSDKDGAQRIYLLEIPPVGTPLKEIVPTCITTRHKENTAPSWSQDGRYIAYCAKVEGIRQIWIRDLVTGQEKALTSGPHHKENPCWAPDSLHLVFNTAINRKSELFVANLHEEGAIRISDGQGLKRFPAWEPRFPMTSSP